MATQLERIAEVAKAKPKGKFTSLMHLINKETVIQSYKEMSGKKVAGVDEVTKEMYSERLEENVEELIARMKRKTSKKKYKASLLRCKEWLKKNRTTPIKQFMKLQS